MPTSPKTKNKMAPVSNNINIKNNGSTSNTKSLSSKKNLSASELAEHLEDLQTSPAARPLNRGSAYVASSSPRQPVDQSFLAFRAAGSTSSLLSAGSTSSNGSSGSSTSSNSNGSGKEAGDDFTLSHGIRNARRDVIPRHNNINHHHHHQQHHHHHQNIHCNVSSSKERYVFSKFPRFTRCGHIYCHPCILQYFQTSESTIAMGSNWRACPVCAEPVHLKQLRPVHFCPATEAKVGQLLHTVLLEKPVGGLTPQPMDPSLRPENTSLASLSPFSRLIPVSQQFVADEIWGAQVKQARLELKTLQATNGDSLESSFMESTLKAMEEKRKTLLQSIKESPSSNSTSPKQPKQTGEFFYFHQSRDGLNVFLHPLCMKILRQAFADYPSIPSELSLPVLQCERLIVDQVNRKRFKYLDHLPLGTQIILAEVDLSGCVSQEILAQFARELSHRNQARLAKSYHDSHAAAGQRTRSILEEWQQMEDDYYWGVQASAAVDIIPPPEMVKLDDLADEASFPLPSSLQQRSSIPPAQPRRPSIPSSHSFAAAAASPPALTFSDLATSLSSPFYHHANVSGSSATDILTVKEGTSSSSLSSSLSSSPNSSPMGASFADALELSPVSTSNNNNNNSKKKIVLFSNTPHRR